MQADDLDARIGDLVWLDGFTGLAAATILGFVYVAEETLALAKLPAAAVSPFRKMRSLGTKTSS